MRRLLVMPLSFLALELPAASVFAANTWCYTHFPDAFFCDDFDRYCETPPPAPEACPIGAPRGGGVFEVWSPTGPCGSQITLEDQWVSSDPFSGRAPCPPTGQLGSSIAPLSTYIRARFGEQYPQVRGTDLTPLVLQCVLDGPVGKMSGFNAYMELMSGNGPQAATDYIYAPACTAACGGDGSSYPIICAQAGAPAGCAPAATAPIKSGLAVGALAYLDANPCHCGEPGSHFPYNNHLVFFDGRQWWILRQELFPGTFPGSGNFILHARPSESSRQANEIRLTIKSTTVKVELTYAPLSEYSWCEIPRQYLGEFSTLNMGFRVPCELLPNSWECSEPITNRSCIKGAPGGGTSTFDNIMLSGGQGAAAPGACCFPDTTCSEIYYGDCEVLGGQFAGPGTTCPSTPCCPPNPGDHDLDGDVDQEDFGWFQTCLSGIDVPAASVPCLCADFDHDGDVDGGDVTTFAGCMLGPGNPADPGCAD